MLKPVLPPLISAVENLTVDWHLGREVVLFPDELYDLLSFGYVVAVEDRERINHNIATLAFITIRTEPCRGVLACSSDGRACIRLFIDL